MKRISPGSSIFPKYDGNGSLDSSDFQDEVLKNINKKE
jgi:hypothetical protein